jgi:hypothetical protein
MKTVDVSGCTKQGETKRELDLIWTLAVPAFLRRVAVFVTAKSVMLQMMAACARLHNDVM